MKYLLLSLLALCCISCGNNRPINSVNQQASHYVISISPEKLIGFHGYMYLLRLDKDKQIKLIKVGPLCSIDDTLKQIGCQIINEGDVINCNGSIGVIIDYTPQEILYASSRVIIHLKIGDYVLVHGNKGFVIDAYGKDIILCYMTMHQSHDYIIINPGDIVECRGIFETVKNK